MKTPLALVASLVAVASSWLLPLAAAGPVFGLAAEAADLNAVAQHYLPMSIVPGPPAEERSRLVRTAQLHRAAGEPVSPEPALPGAALRNADDMYYAVEVLVGKQPVTLQVDTASSDTWVVQSPFNCYNSYQQLVPEGRCGFGRSFAGNLSQGLVPDRSFSILYGDGTFVQGYYGFEDVTLGGLTAKHQQLAVANSTFWFGDNTTSGLLGLSYPFMTDPEVSARQYDPVFTSMWKQGLTSPLFSVALSRRAADPAKQMGSYLAFGGVPPTVAFDEASWARTPILPLHEVESWSFVDAKDTGLYVIRPDGWVYGAESATTPTTNSSKFSVVIDTGATLTYLPLELARSIMAQFDPPAEYVGRGGAWYTDCNAKVPRVGLKIGTQVFYMDEADMLRQNIRDYWATGTQCRVGIMDAYVSPFILGGTFLSNVVAVFDVGNTEMRFAARRQY